ncbi:S-layer homology domain-containing protein [Acetivibrio saccincola]|jgi:hypothetical protein|uniref:S-layer homology domain-containing protein n=1 Tax=Acetivibrio saccincola TaxID=1677857 RepID=UPI0016AFC146|nr:S-layer homology domain-containing protein [Acetivibrio saccincola]NLW27536.1 cellulosome anchor protein [Acetivibrio saccincola]HQD27731.1 S-layer homology domain-containing protein [Acetivibrio saccincola]
MKKAINPNVIAVFLVVLMLTVWTFTLTFVSADNESNLILEFDKTEAEVGEIIKVTARVNNIKKLAGYQINISYDPDVVEVVNPDTGSTSSVIVTGDLITDSRFLPLPVLSNDKDTGLIAIGRIYINLPEYQEKGQVKETGILFETGFKILKKEKTEIKLTNERLPGGIDGTVLFDWEGKHIKDYEVIGAIQEINKLEIPTSEITPEPTPDPTPQEPTATPSLDPTSEPSLKPTTEPEGEILPLAPKLDNSTGEASVTAEIKDIMEAFNNAKTEEGIKKLVLNVERVLGAKSYVIEIPTDLLSYNDLVHKILITTEFGNIEMPSNFFSQKGVSDKIINSATVSFSIKTSDLEGLDEDIKNKIGIRPVVEIDIMADGELIQWNSPLIPIKVSIPYMPLEEPENYEFIVVWHINKGTGGIMPVTSGKYQTYPVGAVEFMTNNFGKFAVAYNYKTFDDISSYSWAKNQIEVLASKGVISGMSETTFAPGEDIKRADFIILLIKSLGLYCEFESNFSDVSPESYYYEYVGMAKELGITSGVGNNMFKPLEKITRQDMMVLTANALKIAGKISDTGNESDISKFSDKDKIASYAVEGVATLVKKGIVVGSGNIINPLGNATRAELAAIIYKIYYI